MLLLLVSSAHARVLLCGGSGAAFGFAYWYKGHEAWTAAKTAVWDQMEHGRQR